MDNNENFKQAAKNAAAEFKKINTPVRLISHFDCDGICSASIMVQALKNLNKEYSLSIVQQLNEDIIIDLSKEDFDCFIFTDLGSGQMDLIEKYLKDKKVFVLDHHELTSNPEHIIQLNPHLCNIDGGQALSGAGVTYFFTKYLTDTNLAHIAIVGAIGDTQDKEGFSALNKEILQDAINNEKMKVIKGLKIFGAQTRPLHKVLEYSSDSHIPDVSGSESGAIQFLHQIGINPKNGKEWKKIVNLTKEELKKLTAAIVLKRSNEDFPEDILSDVYILKEEEKESPFRDAKEFSTLLNACGRMDKAATGVACCLNTKNAKKKAMQVLREYRREIVSALKWYEANADSNQVIKENGYIIINAKDEIKHTMIGTLASILSNSSRIKEKTFILSMARSPENFTKASLRIAGNNNEMDLRKIMKQITEKIQDSEAGGHIQAAGAMFPIEKENEFIEISKTCLTKYS